MELIQTKPEQEPPNFGMLLGYTPCMRHVFALSNRAAQVSMPVLITGETGTGKDLLAKEIHARSSRREKPYVPVNAGTLSRELMLSELFGHEKGAFTGALESKKGRFEEADGGTLFLDEISTMEDRVQVALLRALQEGEFRPVGARSDRRSDVRLIAASNENLEEAVERGDFREDLLHRLQVIDIAIPPLRERRADIPRLATQFLNHVVNEHGFPEKRITAEAMKALQTYHWPGNVRELKNTIAQAALFSDQSAIIALEHIPLRIGSEGKPKTADGVWTAGLSGNASSHDARGRVDVNGANPHVFSAPMGLSVDQLQSLYIKQVLISCEYNKTKAARILGISRKTLYDRLTRRANGEAP